MLRTRQNRLDGTHIILFYLYKQFAPGGADEKVQINSNILNPNVCSQPKAAQVELIKWEESLKRNQELGCAPPDSLLAYRAMESIFSAVFEKADALLIMRWNQLRNDLGLPYTVTSSTIDRVAAFAKAELGGMILLGNFTHNTGMPFTENQKTTT